MSALPAAWPSDYLNSSQPDSTEYDICTRLVLEAYTSAVRTPARSRDAFREAVRVWQGRNPNASHEMARAAVAAILSHKL